MSEGDRGWDPNSVSSHGGCQQQGGICEQLRGIQSTVQECFQLVMAAAGGGQLQRGSGLGAEGAVRGGLQDAKEVEERGRAILLNVQSSMEAFLSLLRHQKSVLSTSECQSSTTDPDMEPVAKPPPVQEDLPLDPDDLHLTGSEEMGLCSPQTSDSVGVSPSVLPGDRELSGPPLLRDESRGIGCWKAEQNISSAPLVLNTNEVPPPPVLADLKTEFDQDGYDFGSTSHEFQDLDSQFDELMEEFVSPDEFCNTFSRFEDEDAETGSRDNPSSGSLEHEAIMLSSGDESDGSEEVEEVDHVMTISEVATEAGVSDLFDPRVLGCPPPSREHTDKLKQYFGHSMFKPEQWKIIYSILYQGRDNCAVMATGFGKSLCYQYPAVFSGKLVVVVSPLISLMEDQVMALNVKGIPAVFLGSAQSSKSAAMSGILRGVYRLVYLTPEYITHASSLLKEMDDNVGLQLIAIDEAHCVSHWGHDFRGDYRTLGEIRSWLPHVPLLALTATATLPVRKDISSSLRLNNPLETCTSFDRSNLYLEVHLRSDSVLGDLKPIMQASKDKSNRTVYSFEGPTIVYCRTKQMTENVAAVLSNAGVNCDKYHAGLSSERRKETHHKFLRDELQCIVATVAFGMGIDKPDIRIIVHYGAPQDIESYYQEIGRAGRDGSPSKCYVFYKTADFNTNRFFLRDLTSQVYKAHKTKMLVKMEKYLATRQCRRRTILSHFANKVPREVGGHRNCCDNCKRNLTTPTSSTSESQHDYTKEGKLLLTLIGDGDERSSLGLGTYVMILRGLKNQRVPSWGKQHDLYGVGMNCSEKWWKAFGFQLKMDGYLQERPIVGSFGSCIELTAKSRKWLSKVKFSSSHPLKITPSQEMLALEKTVLPSSHQPRSYLPQAGPAPSSLEFLPDRGATPTATPLYLPTTENPSNYQTVVVERKVAAQLPPPPQKEPRIIDLENRLYQDLLTFRNQIAHDGNMAPFHVGSNKLLAGLARVRPSSVQRLKQVEGVSDMWVENFGGRMLSRIEEFCKKEGDVPLDVTDLTGMVVEPREITVKVPLVKRSCLLSSLTDTVNISYNLFANQNLSLAEVAKRRNLNIVTVQGHLSDAMEAGYLVDYRRAGLSEEKEEMITNVIRKEPICSAIWEFQPSEMRLKEHQDASEKGMTEKSAVVERAWENHHSINWEETSVPDRARGQEELPVKEALHIQLTPAEDRFNQDTVWSLRYISSLKAIKELLPENIQYSDIKLTIAILAVKTGFVRPRKSSITSPTTVMSSPHSSTTLGSSTSSSVKSSFGSGHKGGWRGGSKRKLPSSFNQSSSWHGSGNFKNKTQRFW